MRHSTFFLAAGVIVLIAAVVPAALQDTPRVGLPGIVTHASWLENPRSIVEMTRLADLAIVAEVVNVRAGRRLNRPKPIPPVDTQLVDFEPTQVIKGNVVSLPITLERHADVIGGRPVISAADGGPFPLGTTHLLFLKVKQDIGYFRLISDQARYRIDSQGLLNPASDDNLAQSLLGAPLADIVAIARTAIAPSPK